MLESLIAVGIISGVLFTMAIGSTQRLDSRDFSWIKETVWSAGKEDSIRNNVYLSLSKIVGSINCEMFHKITSSGKHRQCVYIQNVIHLYPNSFVKGIKAVKSKVHIVALECNVTIVPGCAVSATV